MFTQNFILSFWTQWRISQMSLAKSQRGIALRRPKGYFALLRMTETSEQTAILSPNKMIGKGYSEWVGIHDVLDDEFQCFHT